MNSVEERTRLRGVARCGDLDHREAVQAVRPVEWDVVGGHTNDIVVVEAHVDAGVEPQLSDGQQGFVILRNTTNVGKDDAATHPRGIVHVGVQVAHGCALGHVAVRAFERVRAGAPVM